MSYFLSLFLVFASICTADYSKIFGADYQKAVAFCKNNKEVFASKSAFYQLPTEELKAIVFPELIRFSIFQNFFESMSLELAYVAGGTSYADFSIGNFQMKPSFVEKIELFVNQDSILKKEFKKIISYPDNDLKNQRKIRLDRLQNFEWQMDYLCCFYKIALQLFETEIKNLDQEEKIKFLATAYNVGFDKTCETIQKWMTKPCFPFGVKYPENQQHIYADVAWDYFNRIPF